MLKKYLHTQNLHVGYPSKKEQNILLKDLNLSLEAGKVIALLGNNGTGKSTLIRSLVGVQKYIEGAVYLFGQKIETLNRHKIAQYISLVLTHKPQIGQFSVWELVALGRFPHTHWAGKLKQEDELSVKKALQTLEINHLARKKISQLSDGQVQKVMIARALAQDTQIIILDEPTTHLDLVSKHEIIFLLRKIAKEQNKSILFSTHELELALQNADEIWLISKDQQLETGLPEDLILKGIFQDAFERNAIFFDTEKGTFGRNSTAFSKKVRLTGNKTAVFWTAKALEKINIGIAEEKQHAEFSIEIQTKGAEFVWEIGSNAKFQSLKELIAHCSSINGTGN